MKTRFRILASITGIIALFNTSCVVERTFRPVTTEELLKMPSFIATVEKIDISHPFIFRTEVDLDLKQDSGYEFSLNFAPANKLVVDFAHSLCEGQSYIFPQVLTDYINHQGTNTVKQ
jgi:hypothetical protein